MVIDPGAPPPRPERHIPDRDHASTTDRRARQELATMPVLQHFNRRALAMQKFVTQ